MWFAGFKNLLRNRNSLLVLSLILGLVWDHGAYWIKGAVLPILMILMTVSTLGVTARSFPSLRPLWKPALAGIGMNYAALSTFILLLKALLLTDPDLGVGFVIVAAVPPAIAVAPFTLFLGGDNQFSFIGMAGAYVGALGIAPALSLLLLGSGFISLSRLILIIIELIVAPFVISGLLTRFRIDSRLSSARGPITNWGFFLVSYAIVGLNRETILFRPFTLLPVAFISVASTFFLGWTIERVGRYFRAPAKILTSLVLLGTLKNYGLAGGIALTLFSEKSSIPAAVSSVVMIGYIIWLEAKQKRTERIRIGRSEGTG